MEISSEIWYSLIDILCKDSTKNLGFVFDDNMTLQNQIDNITRLCYINLRKLGRLDSKLSKPLKVQLVHSCILSLLDNYNSVFGCISESSLHKLQKVQNSAVRFIFGLYGKQKWQSISPYLKELHFLPVGYIVHTI